MKTFAIVIIGITLCIGTIFYFFNDLFLNKNIHNRPCTDIAFDSRLWKDSFLIRSRMVNNLIESKRLISLDRDSVIWLLGNPSNDTLNLMSYWFDPKCRIDELQLQMILYIEIDSVQNKVFSNWITD